MKPVLLAALVATIFLTSCSLFDDNKNPDEPDPIAFDPVIEFTECGINLCAKFEVPMDHEDPDGRQIELQVIKKPARNQNEKLGTIFVNPGGPGASGVSFVDRTSSLIFDNELLNKFDIVSWDPRGVGLSTKVTCSENLDPLFDGVNYSPRNQEEKDKLIEAVKWIGEQCAQEDEELLPFLDTQSTVLDLEALRIALKQDQLNYLGYSYGTVIGQMYATQFADNIRTMILDGVADITIEPIEFAKDQAIGFEETLNSFFEYCKTSDCEFNQNRDPKTVYLELSSRIRDNPIKSPRDETLTLGPAQLDIGTAQYLYFGESGWNTLDRGLNDLRSGNPQVLLEGFSNYVGRSSSGDYDGNYISFITIGCADGAVADSETMFKIANEIEPRAPVFGKSGILLSLQCSFWPGFNGEAAEPFELDVDNENPIVLIGTTGDPATPIQWARNAAANIENSVFIENEGEGHTIYGKGNTCIDDSVNQYFITGNRPTRTSC